MTDKNTPLDTDSTKKSDNKTSAPAKKSDSKATEPVKKAETKPSTKKATDDSKQKVSKLAIFAIIIAIILTVIHYFWQVQQSQSLTIELSKQIDSKNAATFNQYQAQIKQVTDSQQKALTSQLQQVASRMNNSNQKRISELNTTVTRLERIIKQRQPSDWLIHEAEYLIRTAARTLWLENDTTASISLLKDADARLADLNDPAFLPVRELVHKDIKSLELLPNLQTDEVVLTLMAMKTQLAMMPLAMVDVGTHKENADNKELSDDINDWKANLAKTWEKFIDDFIRVRQRTGLIEPLVSPQQQQHLKQNLNLKIQLALWAASEQKGDIYQKSLTDIQLWITEFFDLKDPANQQFLDALAKLKTQRVSYNYPSDLLSLTAIRKALKAHEALPETAPEEKQAEPVKTEAAPEEKQAKPVKTEAAPEEKLAEPVKTEAAPEEKLAEPVKTEAAPEEKQAEPVKTQAASEEKQAEPVKTQAASEEKQAEPVKTQAAPEEKQAEQLKGEDII